MRGVVGALAAAALVAAPPAGKDITITVRSVAGKVVRHPHPPAGEVGDEFVSTLVLLDPRTRARVGTMAYSFTILTRCRGLTARCSATARLESTTTFRDGTIRAAGKRVSIAQPTVVVRVRGGTGRYEHARGTLTFGPTTTQTNVYRLSLP
ncbi:MAG TPA: hypothetical protein VFB42_04775 [Gaiellaceae bacterium]|nr:hypothetical protein [Gaiellaceae bacterium]